MWWCIASVMAQEFIVDIGEPVEVRSAGAWIRSIPTDDGWVAIMGGNSSLSIATLSKNGDALQDWVLGPKEPIVSERGLIDHGIQVCPNGNILHAANATVEGSPDDFMHVNLFAPDFSRIFHQEIRDGVGSHAHNDPNVFCSDIGMGYLASVQGMEFATDFFSLDSNGALMETIPLEDYPRGNGGGVWADPVEQVIVQTGMAHGRPLTVNQYDSEWQLLNSYEIDLVAPPLRAYWPQSILRIGDYYLLGHMVRDDAWMGADNGDVYISIFDLDWVLQAQYPITTYNSDAAMRPWIAHKDDQLLISFDAFNEQMLVEARLDLSVFGERDLDVDWDNDAEDTAINPQKEDGCGCQSGSSSILIIPLFFMGLLRRRPL